MRILITGAAGFLGSHFLAHYLNPDTSDDVWAVDLVPHPGGLPMDQQDLEAWLADFDEDVDIAYHFASPVGGRMKIELDPLYNADAFRLDSVFFRWAAKHAKLAVYPSSSAVYPAYLQGDGHRIMLDENLTKLDAEIVGMPDELYGMTKLSGELMALKAEKYGLNTLCIRPFSGYGPGQTADYPVTAIATRAIQRDNPIQVWGDRQRRDFVYVDDIVGATVARIEAGVTGYQVMNIASGVGVTFPVLAEMFAQILGYKPKIEIVADRPVGVINRVGDPTRMLRYYTLKTSLWSGLRQTMESLAVKADPMPPLSLGAIEMDVEAEINA